MYVLYWVVRSCCIGVFDVVVCFFGVAVGVGFLSIVPTPTREVLDLSLTFTGFLFFSALAFALAFALASSRILAANSSDGLAYFLLAVVIRLTIVLSSVI